VLQYLLKPILRAKQPHYVSAEVSSMFVVASATQKFSTAGASRLVSRLR